ncbi:MAG: hypothetical protein CSA42_08345 [Gammaproteobacteria bacterium]|nr:MAG: hypothetical protein CSA42_08345 [Gammaproteobacteria bacterium]
MAAFEYCSLNYLNQWLSHDRAYCQVFSEGNKTEKLNMLKRAADFYKVARNLPKKFDEGQKLERYEPVLEIIESVDKNDFNEDPLLKIREIEGKISKKYGNRSVLSLTTKFLWLKIKQPILIYDSQARIALNVPNGDLEKYYDKWRVSFGDRKNEIIKACSELPKMHLYTIDNEVGTQEYIKSLVGNSWFHERVFDIYLWNEGKKP